MRSATVLIAATLVACFQPSAEVCVDGRVCAPGTVCVPGLDLCADRDHVQACAGSSDGDGCSAVDLGVGTCSGGVCFPSGCGNGVLENGEECDDGNTRSNDGCSSDCLSTEICGNGIIDRGEQCDCGTSQTLNQNCSEPNSPLGGLCRTDCVLHCGDGFISGGEQCDPGASFQPSCVELEGESFDRGLTSCSSACTPIISTDTCMYIGLRVSESSGVIIELAPHGNGGGFYAAPGLAGKYQGSMQVGVPTSPAAGRTFTSIWSPDASTAVVVGTGGTIARWDGIAWSQDVPPVPADLHDVWGRGASDIYAVGDGGTILHWDGTVWTVIPSGTGERLRGIAGTTAALYAVGEAGTLLVDSGAGFATIDAGSVADLRGVWAIEGMAVAVGTSGTILEDRGTGWGPGRVDTTADLSSVWGSDADGFFAVGTGGTVLFFDGAVWRPLSMGNGVPNDQQQPLLSVSGVSDTVVTFVSKGGTFSYEGAAWSPTASPTSATIYDLWGTGTDDVFAVGRGGTILHHDGLRWTVHTSGTSADLHAVWGHSRTDVYAAGDSGTLLHYDGVGWSLVATAATADLRDGWSVNGGDLVVGLDHTLLRRDGGTWSDLTDDLTNTGFDLYAVWAADFVNVVVGGLDGARGGTIPGMPLGTWAQDSGPASIHAIHGAVPNRVYVVGGAVYVWDGALDFIPLPVTQSGWRSVWARNADQAVAVGSSGQIGYWNGNDEDLLRSRTVVDLHAVYVAGHVVFMAGEDGALQTMVLHR